MTNGFKVFEDKDRRKFEKAVHSFVSTHDWDAAAANYTGDVYDGRKIIKGKFVAFVFYKETTPPLLPIIEKSGDAKKDAEKIVKDLKLTPFGKKYLDAKEKAGKEFLAKQGKKKK